MTDSGTDGTNIDLIKLGGSLITDKTRPRTARIEVIARLASEIKIALESAEVPVVVGHGSGSFGHVAAKEFAIHRGVDTVDQLPGVGITQEQASQLHSLVVESLIEAGVPIFSLAPSSFTVASAGVMETLWPEPLIQALRIGLVPAIYGDVVMDKEWGASICSTEALFLALAPALASRGRFVRRVIWLGETEGVLDDSGEVIPEIDVDDMPELIHSVEGAAGVDVTGGIRLRLEAVQTLARLGVPSWIGNGLEAGSLVAALAGAPKGGTNIFSGR